jgi:hypothetical protein
LPEDDSEEYENDETNEREYGNEDDEVTGKV